jgi:hypothetical protein
MNWMLIVAIWAFLVFNLPVVVLLVRLPFLADLREALKEKGPIGGLADTTSYSRVTGLVGAVILTSFFWAMGNLVLFKAIDTIGDIKPLVAGVSQLFLIGAALFLPYAFNQLKTAAGAAWITAAAQVAPAPQPPTAPVLPGPNLKITVANLSKSIDDAAFATVVAAIGIQVARDFQPEWGAGANLSAQRMKIASGTVNIDYASDAVIYVGDSSSDPTTGVQGALGYHATNFGKLPYAFIYLDICAQANEPWSCTLSHEILELLADPTAVYTVNGPAPGNPDKSVSYDLEVCDPTQGDTYSINDTVVSNFVHRSYFGMAGPAASTNHLGLQLAPFGVRPGGYFQYEDPDGAHTVNGPQVGAARLAARAMMLDQRRNSRRAAQSAFLSPSAAATK